MLRTGKVLFFSYENKGSSSVLDTDSGTLTRPALGKDLFCAGQAFLPDGQLLVAGGNGTPASHGSRAGLRSLHTFRPSGTWQYLRDLSDERWYPTCTTLPNGRVFVISSTRNGGGPQNQGNLNNTYEIFDPQSGTLQSPRPAPILDEAALYSLYPFVFVLPSGKLLIHVNNRTRFLNLSTWSFDSLALTTIRPAPRTYPLEGTCVLLPLLPTTSPPYRARVMLMGGGGLPLARTTPATNTCEVLDLGASSPAWQSAASMLHPRVMPDAVLLPDGTVLVMNGSSAGKADDAINPIFQAELYNPATNTWSPLCSMRTPRLYHSTALLLPDGRVLTAGNDEEFNQHPFHYHEYRVEVFSPPYLFKGPRPQIAVAPTTITYGASFIVETPDASSVTSAALICPGAVTHSFNMTQRYVGLSITARGASRMTLEAPPNSNVAPPGFYMLFLVTSAGVPSVAQFVRLQ